jgi:hypothetical protein
VAAVITAIGGGLALQERSGALNEAKESAAHLVLVQSVQIQLAQADANVTNSFLKFGLEPENQQATYIASIQAASRDLALAASASSEDAEALGKANAALTRYTGYIGSARANNRLGKPVGANYLTTAHALLTSDVVKPLAIRAAADADKVDDAYSRAAHAAWWLALVAIVGLGVLVWAQFFLARHSRRILNLPLVAATVGLLVGLIVAAGAMAIAQSKANDVRDGALADARALSASRVAAFNAKAQESLTLINRGSATDADKDWKALVDEAQSSLPPLDTEASDALARYQTLHEGINETDVAGNWDKAVVDAVAPGTTAEPSANSEFAKYAATTDQALQVKAASATSALGDAGGALLPAGILVVLLGLLAAIAAWLGVSLRLDEYR